jgi:glutamyl-tRNA synthetase
VMKLSQRLVHAMGFSEVADRLGSAGVGGGEAFWLAVRGNLQRVEDAKLWWDIAVSESIQPSPDLTGDDRAFLALAAQRFPEGPVDPLTWKAWTDALKAETGRGGKTLFLPLRRALTGRDQGPELSNYLPFIGRERGLARLA